MRACVRQCRVRICGCVHCKPPQMEFVPDAEDRGDTCIVWDVANAWTSESAPSQHKVYFGVDLNLLDARSAQQKVLIEDERTYYELAVLADRLGFDGVLFNFQGKPGTFVDIVEFTKPWLLPGRKDSIQGAWRLPAREPYFYFLTMRCFLDRPRFSDDDDTCTGIQLSPTIRGRFIEAAVHETEFLVYEHGLVVPRLYFS